MHSPHRSRRQANANTVPLHAMGRWRSAQWGPQTGVLCEI
ncbi:hypothetical protein I552_6505 [Mycobacterium xenopi 3993]|nr:hypothetical protein I552_6505 [Mycobacterium xenopi 3993]